MENMQEKKYVNKVQIMNQSDSEEYERVNIFDSNYINREVANLALK